MRKDSFANFFSEDRLVAKKADKKEIREGWFFLQNKKWLIKNGILVAPKFSKSVQKEQKAIKTIDSRPDLGGSIQGKKEDFFTALESLPELQKNNPFFQNEGAFLNISLGAKEYLEFVKSLKKPLTILEIGADSGWSAARLSRKHQVVALDISDHLFLRDFWLKKGYFFEAVQADMNQLPFKDETFDLVFASAAIHHSQNLEKVSSEIFRCLKSGGRFVFLREPMRGKRAKNDFAKLQKDLGVSENLYSKEQWQKAFQKAGFKDLKISLAHLDYPQMRKYLPKKIKKNLLKIFPVFQNWTVSDYNFTGKKLEKGV